MWWKTCVGVSECHSLYLVKVDIPGCTGDRVIVVETYRYIEYIEIYIYIYPYISYVVFCLRTSFLCFARRAKTVIL